MLVRQIPGIGVDLSQETPDASDEFLLRPPCVRRDPRREAVLRVSAGEPPEVIRPWLGGVVVDRELPSVHGDDFMVGRDVVHRGILRREIKGVTRGQQCDLQESARPHAALSVQDGLYTLPVADPDVRLVVGAANPELNARLSDELSAFNDVASGDPGQRSMSVEARGDAGKLIGGLMGWTWGTCAGIEMLWVDEAHRRGRWGSRLITAAEEEARARGCVQMLVSSFTFQAPDFYRRLGYVEFARSEGLPAEGMADVHFRKDI